MADYLTKMRTAIDAAAEGRLKCVNCGEHLTVLDPFTNKVVKVREFAMWVEDGEPVAWCCG